MMHVLQAKRISAFTSRYNRFDRLRYENARLPVNYAAFTNNELDSLAQLHFERARNFSANMNKPGDIMWLATDSTVFLFKPTFFDLLIEEQISRTEKQSPVGYRPRPRQISWLSLSPDEFINRLDSLSFDDPDYDVLTKYREWLSYNKDKPAIYYFIETLARKYFYGKSPSDDLSGTRSLYEKYLRTIALSEYKPVRIHGVYQLCLLWNQQAANYFPGGRLYYKEANLFDNDFDSIYRYHAAMALQLFDKNRVIFDDQSFLRNILLEMERKIRQSYVYISLSNYHLPDSPILAEMMFKNADSLFYRIVKVNAGDHLVYTSKQDVIRYLLHLYPISDQLIYLPSTNYDHNRHAAYLKLDGLPAGTYSLLFSLHPLTDSNQEVENMFFHVSSIAIINHDKRMFVLDRRSGQPIAGAKLERSYIKRIKKDSIYHNKKVSKTYTVYSQGFVIVQNEKISLLRAVYGNDTVFATTDVTEEVPDDIYDKEDYDGLVEFYEENAFAYIYTDKGIYRPGQTIYFKAIFLTIDPKTGKSLVMSRQNLGSSVFRNVYKKWLKESEPELYLIDPFGRETDTIKVRPNEFGSVSGSFKIPRTAATGVWSIETDYIEEGNGGGGFRVEEYKRPAYEVMIEKPKKELQPGDAFAFTIKVKSFAGAALNNVRVPYAIERMRSFRFLIPLLARQLIGIRTRC